MKNNLKILLDNNKYKDNHIEFTLTSACTAMCSYCPQSRYIKAYKNLPSAINAEGENILPKNLSLEDFKLYLSNVNHLVNKIYFTGYTEPLQNPEWFEIVNHAIKEKYDVFLNTTLIGASENDINKLLMLDIPLRIHLSDSRIKIEKDYYKLISKEYRGKVSFDYFTEEGRKLFGADTMPIELGSINSRGDNLPNLNSEIKRGPIFCSEYRHYSNVVLPNGEVSLCCTDFGLKNIIGSLKLNKLYELHNSTKFFDIISNMAYGKRLSICNSCHYAVNFKNYNHNLTIVNRRFTSFKKLIKNIIFSK